MATKPKSKAKSRHDPRGSRSAASREERIEDVNVSSLVFTSSSKGLSTGIGSALEDGTLEETMHGASGLKLSLLDRDYAAMQSGLYNTRVSARVDGAPFRLTEVSVADDWKVQAVLEHSLVAEMREHTSPLKARRGKVTRAEFILMMLRELRQPFVFVCPELHKSQPTPAPEKTKETVTTKTGKHGKVATTKKKAKKNGTVTNLAEVGKGPAVGPTVTKSPTKTLTSKHVPLTHAQSELLGKALSAAHGTGANRLSMTALVVALINENDVSNPDPGTPGDRGCLSLIDSTAHGIQKKTGSGTINPYDIAEVCEHFCTAGYSGHGGSNALARANPRDSATHIAYLVQGPKVEYTHAYEHEAYAIVDAFLATGVGGSAAEAGGGSFSGEGSNTASKTVVRTATYEFTRGQPGQRESTFECCLRLAEEVGWSFFVSGRNEIYFVNDDDLLHAAPRYVIKPDSPGFQSLTFDVEVGARTVISKGKRNPKASEATLVVRADRWAAPPGCVIRLDGWGPADHPWLVDSVERGLYDATTTIQIRAPQHPLEEPKATASGTGEPGKEVTGSGGEGAAAPEGGGTGTEATASPSVERRLASQHPELHYKVRRVVAIILTQYPQLSITSTTGGNHVSDSYHYRGMAADLAGGNMDAIGSWISRNLASRLTEGIHNPTLAVKNNAHVSGPSVYSSVWAGHRDHIHIAVAG